MSDAAAGIGRAYDAVPYDGGAQHRLSLARVRGAAAALGFVPAAGPVLDVLDVGCGTGAQLFLAAQHSAGRMVGIDASELASAQARARGAALGERWRIVHGDAATLDPAVLGRFDVIQVIGTLYILPAEARVRLLAGVAGCLKPGGIVVMNYYTGLMGLARTRLARLLHNSNDSGWTVERQVATGRANLQQIADIVPDAGVARDLVLATLSGMKDSRDTVLFHEAFGAVFDTLTTADVEAALSPHGVSFLNYMPPARVLAGAVSRAAAQAVDAWDFATGGGYRVALFGRGDGMAGAGLRHPGLVWTTSLQAAAASDDAVQFSDPALGVEVRTSDAVAQAVIARLIAGPRGWGELGAAGDRGAELLAMLWGAGVAWPEFPAGG